MQIINFLRIKREVGSVQLVVVTKTRSVEDIRRIINHGAEIIAESRVQEAKQKYEGLKNDFQEKKIKFHLIGHLQKNKVKIAVSIFDVIQSLDSLELAEEINKRAKEIDKIQDVLVQVNIGKEKQKYGIMPEDTVKFVQILKKLKNLQVKGLMCIAPHLGNPEQTRPYFRLMHQIFEGLDVELLSMGMTNDYKVAIEEGSNMVRIGSGIFGEGKQLNIQPI